jgi:hypothetical protein
MALTIGIWQARDRFGLEPRASLTVDEEGDQDHRTVFTILQRCP